MKRCKTFDSFLSFDDTSLSSHSHTTTPCSIVEFDQNSWSPYWSTESSLYQSKKNKTDNVNFNHDSTKIVTIDTVSLELANINLRNYDQNDILKNWKSDNRDTSHKSLSDSRSTVRKLFSETDSKSLFEKNKEQTICKTFNSSSLTLRILIFESDENIISRIKNLLSDYEIQIVIANKGQDILNDSVRNTELYDVAIIETNLIDMHEIDVGKFLKSFSILPPILYLTPDLSKDFVMKLSIENGLSEVLPSYISKADIDKLLTAKLETLLKKQLPTQIQKNSKCFI